MMHPWPETTVVKIKRTRHIAEKCLRKECQDFVTALRGHIQRGEIEKSSHFKKGLVPRGLP